MKFKSIKIRMLAMILPIILVAVTVFTMISVVSGKNIIDQQVTDRMKAEQEAKSNAISKELDKVYVSANNLAATISEIYKTADLTQIEHLLSQVAESEDIIFGAGVWFEANVYDEDKTYVGPYAYRDGSSVVTTYEYSTPEYDYFKQDYYTIAKMTPTATMTKPYYDDNSKMYLSSCTAAIYNSSGGFAGCVTVDIVLDDLQGLITSAQIGDSGSAFLIDGDGIYLGHQDQSKVEAGLSILEEENSSLAEAAKIIMDQESGMTTFTDSKDTYRLYYGTIPDINWKIVFQIPESEINAPVNQLIVLLLIVGAVVVVITSASILLQISFITKRIRNVKNFVEKLDQRDYTTPDMNITAQDEIGKMGISLNGMYQSNKAVITDMAEYSHQLDESSHNLHNSAEELMKQFHSIQEFMSAVNEAMMASSAATEEVNASTEEVDSYITLMTEESEQSRNKTKAIGQHAKTIKDKSQDAYTYATQLAGEYQNRLQAGIDNIAVVDSIGDLAKVISGIAGQINLLSLNASIEAARAGEHGAGFSVVALEIGKLANETSSAVNRISDTISLVKNAVDELVHGSSSLLTFVEDTVTPDYNYFIDVAKQYGNDADEMYENAERIAEMSENIKRIMSEVGDAIGNITESTQATAENSSRTLESVHEVAKVVNQVTEMSDTNRNISGNLNQIVDQFKLS